MERKKAIEISNALQTSEGLELLREALLGVLDDETLTQNLDIDIDGLRQEINILIDGYKAPFDELIKDA